MDKELKKLIEGAMEPLERFCSERKRIIAAVLAESSFDLLPDDYFDSAWANSVTQELERREILKRGQEGWMMRHLIDRLSQLGSGEDSSLPKLETDGAETMGDSGTGQSQAPHSGQM